MSAVVTDRDHGYAALIQRVIGLQTRVSIVTGILAKDADKQDGDSGRTVLEVATINEFGSEDGAHPPARSFIRAWFDSNLPAAREKLRTRMILVVKGKLTREQALAQVGAWCVGQIQQRISDHIAPENKKSTTDRKHSSTPLVDTGVLRSSISFEVREE